MEQRSKIEGANQLISDSFFGHEELGSELIGGRFCLSKISLKPNIDDEMLQFVGKRESQTLP